MEIKIQPGANGYLVVTQSRPQSGELLIHVSQVEQLAEDLKKAVIDFRKSEKRGPDDSSFKS